MDAILIIIAFALGFSARQVGLPLLVGYLVAGFVIKASGVEGETLIFELFKVALFFLLLTCFKLRARTSLLGSFSLGNYSEFGLIVGAIGVTNGWISSEWLVIIAIALSTTFILASPLNAAAHNIYKRFTDCLKSYETKTRHPDDQPIDQGDAEIALFGMGRAGSGAYNFFDDAGTGLAEHVFEIMENQTSAVR